MMGWARIEQAVPSHPSSSLQQLAQRFDVWLAGAALLLLLLGLIMIASASISIAERDFGKPLYFFWRQAAYAGIGLALAAGRSFGGFFSRPTCGAAGWPGRSLRGRSNCAT